MDETDIARLTRERDEAREALAEFLNEPCKDCLGYEAQMSGMEDAYRDSERGRRDAEAEAKRMSQAAAENFDEAVAAQEAALAAESRAVAAEKERDESYTRYNALLWQIANEGCVSARVGKGTRECGLPECGLCRLVHDRDFYRENSAALGHALEIGNAKIDDLRALLLEVAEGGVEFDDPRVRYVAVQIDADTWARVKALTAPAEEEEREGRGKEKGEV